MSPGTSARTRPATGARLLEAATEMFRERGVEVGVGEIADRAGVGRGTLFRNFPTKQELVVAVIAHRMARGDRDRPRAA